MKSLLKYFNGKKVVTILAPFFKLLEATLELIVPLIVANIVDVGIGNNDSNYVIKYSILLIIIGVVGLAFSITSQYFSANSATTFAVKVRSDLFRKVNNLSFDDLDRVGTSTLITRLTGDVNKMQDGVNLTLRLLLRSPFIVIGACVGASLVDGMTSIVFWVALPLLTIIVFAIVVYGTKLHKKSQEELDNVTTLTRENVSGMRVIRMFCREDSEVSNFKRKNKKLESAQILAGKLSALLNPLTYTVVNVCIILIIYFGGKRVDSGVMTQGQVIALYNYLTQILIELIKLANLVITVSKAIASAKRVSEVLNISPSQEFASDNVDTVDTENKIEFRNVSLRYDGDNVLNNISLKIKKGSTLGIIGGTGSGKSSLVNLIPRFYDATQGEVLVDGINVNSYPKQQLRDKISIVMQKPFLIEDSIENNLVMGRTVSEEVITEAIRASQSSEIIASKKLGLREKVERNGSNFSGGQKQRLSVARAFVKGGEIIILDDTTASLDALTSARLRQEIKNLNVTTIIVSQRPACVKNADVIIVLDEGKIVGQGTHEELLVSCEIYKDINALGNQGGNDD